MDILEGEVGDEGVVDVLLVGQDGREELPVGLHLAEFAQDVERRDDLCDNRQLVSALKLIREVEC